MTHQPPHRARNTSTTRAIVPFAASAAIYSVFFILVQGDGPGDRLGGLAGGFLSYVAKAAHFVMWAVLIAAGSILIWAAIRKVLRKGSIK